MRTYLVKEVGVGQDLFVFLKTRSITTCDIQ